MKMRSLSFFGLCFFLMVGLSGQVGAQVVQTKEQKEKQRELLEKKEEERLAKEKERLADVQKLVLKQFRETKKCVRCDLSGVDLNRVNLTGANLTEANLTNANLTGANLTGANLTNAKLTGANLTDIQIDDKATATNKLLMAAVKENKKEEKKKEKEEKEKNRLYEEKLKTAVGYKDLKIGMTVNDLNALKVCKDQIKFKRSYSRCYDKDWLFQFYFPNAEHTMTKAGKSSCSYGSSECDPLTGTPYMIGNPELEVLYLKIGVYVQESHNKFRDLLGKKYKTEYNFGDIEIERYNKGEIEGLYDVFEGGQVALAIEKIDNQHLSFIQYRNESYAKELLKNVIPKKDKSDDF